jgi:hypothetical protein
MVIVGKEKHRRLPGRTYSKGIGRTPADPANSLSGFADKILRSTAEGAGALMS